VLPVPSVSSVCFFFFYFFSRTFCPNTLRYASCLFLLLPCLWSIFSLSLPSLWSVFSLPPPPCFPPLLDCGLTTNTYCHSLHGFRCFLLGPVLLAIHIKKKETSQVIYHTLPFSPTYPPNQIPPNQPSGHRCMAPTLGCKGCKGCRLVSIFICDKIHVSPKKTRNRS